MDNGEIILHIILATGLLAKMKSYQTNLNKSHRDLTGACTFKGYPLRY